MEVLAALGLGAKELFNYNRENFKFDQDQRLERETLRLEMQVKRFELFREDVRDLVELTVDRMDVYHLVGALFLEFCIVLFCEGRVQASAPPFLLSLFLLSNACAFIYLLLAVWLSMHASIAAHSFGVRLLTRFVRLPIPSVRQMESLRTQLRDYEKQGVANLLRLPFQDKQDWVQRGDDEAAGSGTGSGFIPGAGGSSANLLDLTPAGPSRSHGPEDYLVTASSASSGAPPEPASFSPEPFAIGRPMQSRRLTQDEPMVGQPALRSNRPEDMGLLPEEADHPMGGEDLLTGLRGARPERHVQLFRQLQAKWQCYDAYCRVCMGLGVNQILQGLSYYCICHTLVENRSPTTGYALVTLFQSTTVALAVLDLAGLKRREILVIQIIGIMPCALTAWGIAHGARDDRGVMDPAQDYMMSPLSFLLQVLWLELWLRVAAPSGEDTAKLPRRFRQILFLDVFGDAADASEGIDGAGIDKNLVADMLHDVERDQEADGDDEALAHAASQAASQLAMAQCAVRRWCACPDWSFSKKQEEDLAAVRERLKTWGNAVHTELIRHKHHGSSDSVFEPELRPWRDLSQQEKLSDPFAKTLIGPFEHHDGYSTTSYHYDLETGHTLYGEAAAKERPGALVLTLPALATIMEDLERAARRLLEQRIMRDLRAANRRQQLAARERQRGHRERWEREQALRRGNSCPSEGPRARTLESIAKPVKVAKESFPNLMSILRKKDKGPVEDRGHLLTTAAPSSREDDLMHAASAPSFSSSSRAASSSSGYLGVSGPPHAASSRSTVGGRDPTLVAMAGRHARHFVPERLPWQVLSRMTRVLQACWFWSGMMALLKEMRIYQVDFQQHPGHERRLSVDARLAFTDSEVEWPHGSFFKAQALFCPPAPSDEIWVGGPFALFSGNASASMPGRFEQLEALQLPPAAAALCVGDRRGIAGRAGSAPHAVDACIFAAPAEGGDALSLWSLRPPARIRLPLEPGAAEWRLVTGGALPCGDAPWLLLPTSESHDAGEGSPSAGAVGERQFGEAADDAGDWCLLLAGWDGELLPVALLPLRDGPGSLPESGLVLRPGLDVPLAAAAAADGAGPGLVSALHFQPSTGRLWALLDGGVIEAWDLLDGRSLGLWRSSWPSAAVPRGASPSALVAAAEPLRPAFLCEHASLGSLWVLGRGAGGRLRLLRASVPPARAGRAAASGEVDLQGALPCSLRAPSPEPAAPAG